MSDKLQITKTYLEAKTEIDKITRENEWLIRPGRWLVWIGGTASVTWAKILDVYYKQVEVEYRNGEKLDEVEYEEQLMILVEDEHDEGRTREHKWDYHKQYNYIIVDRNPEEILAEGLEEFENEEFTTPYDHDSKEPNTKTTALATLNKNSLVSHKEKLMMRRDYLNAKREIVLSHVKSKLEKLRNMKGEMMTQLNKLNKIIHTIEVYLGINESIDHIIQGEKASEDTPVTFRQKILYIDEEVGDPTDDGYDFRNIRDFYEWLGKESGYWKIPHYELLIPEEKCVVVFQIRRKDKKYSDNPFVNVHMNKNNKQTLFAIRNGENVWCVWADLRVYPRLFPGKTEIQDMVDRLNSGEWDWSEDRLKEEIENESFRYQLQFLVLQGLIERKDIFGNSLRDINLLNMDLQEEPRVNFIYDDTDPMLDDSFGNFKKWKKELNDQIKTGNRILFLGHTDSRWHENWHYYLLRWQHWNSYPSSPGMGIHTLLWDKENERHYFKYLPDDTVWDPGNIWEYGEFRGRKNRVSYYPHSEDYINYDALEEEDFERIEYALHSRVNRHNYIRSVPMLLAMLKFRKAELEEEENFIQMIYSDFNKRIDSYDVFRKEHAKPAISWWKFKNKYKRSLLSDDSKAVRMIKNKIERELNK